MNGQRMAGAEERIIFQLRSLYDRYGYTQFKMSKFEEYDLYAQNKDFLISDSVLTFTDLDGKLMALKPDVTLSIVKNCNGAPSAVQKLYYNENVYRVSGTSRCFRELMQVGLECIGTVDTYCICEVLLLALESLMCISGDCVLTVSHLGLVQQVLDTINLPAHFREPVLRAVGQKNGHELARLCMDAGLTGNDTKLLCTLAAARGKPSAVAEALVGLLQGKADTNSLAQLLEIAAALEQLGRDRIIFDFSIVDDVQYYSGIVFKGFIAGLPGSVLTGGQYDKLMKKLGHSCSAIGFAVYMDGLDRLFVCKQEYSADILLLYNRQDPSAAVFAKAQQLRQRGCSVMVQLAKPENMRFRCILHYRAGEDAADA